MKRKTGIHPSAPGTRALVVPCFLLVAGLVAVVAGAGPAAKAGVVPETAKARALAAYGSLSLSFVPNMGRLDRRVRYSAQAGGAGLFFTKREAVFSLAGEKSQGLALRLRFLGANPHVRIVGAKRAEGRVNYLRGTDPAMWQTDVPTYRELVYRGLWPGIDLVFRGERGVLKYELHVDPGASLERARLAYAGAEGISLDGDGNLLVETAHGTLRDSRPISYQVVDGRRVPVASRFLLRPGSRTYGFAVGGYDRGRPLVVDPGLVYSSYLGGGAGEYGGEIAVDGAGNTYITGLTASARFPTTAGALDTSASGTDAFVTKLNATGSALVYSTYLGGSGEGEEEGRAIAVDGAGRAYVTGNTFSTDFPTSARAFDRSADGNLQSVFVAKLNAAGSGLVYSTYLGGGSEFSAGLAVDGAGNAYVTGGTASADFPTTTGALDRSLDFGDAFVTKLNATGSALVYSTFLGGSGSDTAGELTVDGAGRAYVTGGTDSVDFPTTAGALDTSLGGRRDAFVAKLNATGSALVFSTYLGGGGRDSDREEYGNGIAVDRAGRVYVSGATDSPDFPTTRGAFDTSWNSGEHDAFVTKLNAAGSAVVYSTFVGGPDPDWGGKIAVDGQGRAYVTGTTWSAAFPTTAGALDTRLGGIDAFVTKLNAAGSSLLYSTYLGGSADETGYGLALDRAGSAYVVGPTNSADFPTTRRAFDRRGGFGDLFVAKLDLRQPCRCRSVTVRLAGPTGREAGTAEATELWDFHVKGTIACQPGDALDCAGFVRTESPATATLTPKVFTCKGNRCDAKTRFAHSVRIRISHRDVLAARARWEATRKPLEKKLRLRTGCRGEPGRIHSFTLAFTNGNDFSSALSDRDGDGNPDGRR